MNLATYYQLKKDRTITIQKSTLQYRIISINPIRITAALVLSPHFIPSMKPAPTATMFFKAPQISTVSLSPTTVTRKLGDSNRVLNNAPLPITNLKWFNENIYEIKFDKFHGFE